MKGWANVFVRYTLEWGKKKICAFLNILKTKVFEQFSVGQINSNFKIKRSKYLLNILNFFNENSRF